MIRFIDVTEKTFDMVFEKMTTAFPYEERRDYSDQKRCLEDEKYKFFEIADGDIPVGFISLWKYDTFVYIEHIAIDNDKRGGGYGSKAIELVKKLYKLPIVLEAEAPVTEQQIKRIRFYNRLDFKVNSYDYTQPSYHGGDGVPLKILSYPKLLTEDEFGIFIKETQESAYTYVMQTYRSLRDYNP